MRSVGLKIICCCWVLETRKCTSYDERVTRVLQLLVVNGRDFKALFFAVSGSLKNSLCGKFHVTQDIILVVRVRDFKVLF